MTNDLVSTIQSNGQTFTIRISHPKPNYKYRGYLTDAANNELGSGRWDTVRDAKSALQAMASRVAQRAAGKS